MTDHVIGLNADVLKWARERAGYSLESTARSFGKEKADIERWESGDDSPSYAQLEKLAYSLYKRPLALFFFPSIPEEPDAGQAFRTFPQFEIDNLSPDTLYAIRQARGMQITLEDLNDGVNQAKQKIFHDLSSHEGSSILNVAENIREYLGVDLRQQISWRNREEALRNWRNIVEEHGIFVFKRSLKQRDISGFCIFDDQFPVIYLNSSTVETRQIFTLFHELAHILLRINGITKRNDRFINSLTGTEKRMEVFCNQLTAEFLVPSKDFEQFIGMPASDDGIISGLANRYNVSREVILRRFLDLGEIDRRYYDKKSQEWTKQIRKPRSGGDYYNQQAMYLGTNFLNLAFSKYYQGRCNIEQLADYLNVKVTNVLALEKYCLGNV